MRLGLAHSVCFSSPIVVLHVPEMMPCVVGRRLDSPRFVANRVSLIVPHEDRNIPVEGGGEEKGLFLRGCLIQDPLDCRQEAHVRHAVRLVDYNNVDVGETHQALIDEVLESSRCRHENINTAVHRCALLAVGDATVNGEDIPAHRPRQWCDLIFDLLGELTGRCEDQAPRVTLGRIAHAGNHRDPEGQGLARSGRGLTGDVTAIEAVGDRCHLDREGRDDALLLQDA
jgi:hypothetical protein